MTKYTHAEFEKILKEKYGAKYSLLSEYVGAKYNVLVKCNECGLTSKRLPVKLLFNGACKGCFGKGRTKSHEQFNEQIFNKYGNEFSLLSRYTLDRNKIKVRHNLCGAEYEITASSLLQNGGCRFCQPARLRAKFAKTTEEFMKHVNDTTGGEYTVLGEYINANKKILIKHNRCGNEYMTKPNVFVQGSRCPKCAIEAQRSKDTTNRKIIRNIRSRIIHILLGRKKSAPTLKLIGCTRAELRTHLEALFTDGMTWENYGKSNGWQVDHIRPCASFDLTDPRQQRECFHYTNLQPLWATENRRKHSWWNGVHYGVDVIAPKAVKAL
ncbi:MAG: hypothetical protein M0021_09900 [Clostridia bacterium]|nr:hypothetical protein [Clostridia bacterium]